MSTFNDTHFEFDAEAERLEDEIEELKGEFDDEPSPATLQQLKELKSQRKGVIWARDQAPESDDFPFWDEAVDGVTLGAVTAGTYGQVQNDIGRDPDAGEGTANTLVVADATVEAPYVKADPDQTVAAVAQCHPYYVQWAKTRVDDLLDPESGNGTSSGISPGEKRAEPTSTDE